MKEYINIELCSKCRKCCEIYGGELFKPVMPNIKMSFHRRKPGDWNEQAFIKYGVYPLRDPLKNEDIYCEFYDISTGCIIERERRPYQCRLYACKDLKENYIEEHEVDLSKVITRPTQYIYDKETNAMTQMFEPVDASITQELYSTRMNICQSCPNLFYHKAGSMPSCKLCGCGLTYKTTVIYPLDKDGKAFSFVEPNGNHIYVCRAQKW